MGQMRIGTGPGESVEWDPRDKDSVAAAYRVWARLRREGYEFFSSTGRKLTRFNKRHGLILAVPRP